MNTKNYTVVEHSQDEIEDIVLETKSAQVIDFPSKPDREWLMRDVMSTPYATIMES
jgi:hypothetical protein